MTSDLTLWYLVGAVVSGIIAACLAPSRDIPTWAGFGLGLILGVFGIAIVALFRPVKYDAPTPVAFPPGWYPDPTGQPVQRWWTGTQWV